MPPKQASVNDTVALTKKIGDLAKALADVEKRFEDLDQYRSEALAETHTKMGAAVAEYDCKMTEMKQKQEQVLAEMDQERKRKRVDDEIELKEHGREVAVALLNKDGFDAIRSDELVELRKELAETKAKLDKIKKETEESVTKELTRDHGMVVERIQLTNKAEIAKLTEQNNMLLEKVETLEGVCENLRKDVAAGQETIKCFAGRPTIVKTDGGRRD